MWLRSSAAGVSVQRTFIIALPPTALLRCFPQGGKARPAQCGVAGGQGVLTASSGSAPNFSPVQPLSEADHLSPVIAMQRVCDGRKRVQG